jgi:hypothetical protein
MRDQAREPELAGLPKARYGTVADRTAKPIGLVRPSRRVPEPGSGGPASTATGRGTR